MTARIMEDQGMNFSGNRHPDKERKSVLQMLWNFVSILIITVLLVQWPATVSPVPRPFQEEWPTIIEMMDWAGTNDGTGKLSQDAYEKKWELYYGIGTKITRELINGSKKTEVEN